LCALKTTSKPWQELFRQPEQSATERKTAPPKYGPNHYKLKLSEADRHAKLAQHAKQGILASPREQQARFARAAVDSNHAEATMLAANATKEEDFSKCLQEATKDPCQKISGCKDPVCNRYYDDPEIEALCGMCTMAPGAGCFAHSSEVSFYYFGICIFVCIWKNSYTGGGQQVLAIRKCL
jgi:hypothetical protein